MSYFIGFGTCRTGHVKTLLRRGSTRTYRTSTRHGPTPLSLFILVLVLESLQHSRLRLQSYSYRVTVLPAVGWSSYRRAAGGEGSVGYPAACIVFNHCDHPARPLEYSTVVPPIGGTHPCANGGQRHYTCTLLVSMWLY